MSRQANYERRQASELADAPGTTFVSEPIVNPDDALLYLVANEPDTPPYTVAVNDGLPIERATIDRLAAAGMLTLHESDGSIAVETTGKGVLHAIAIQNAKAASAKASTASAGTSPAAA